MIPEKRNRLSGAVTECVAKCMASDTPLTILAEFVEILRGDGWTSADIHAVELAVLRVVANVVHAESGRAWKELA